MWQRQVFQQGHQRQHLTKRQPSLVHDCPGPPLVTLLKWCRMKRQISLWQTERKAVPQALAGGQGTYTGSIALRVAAFGNEGCLDGGNPRLPGKGRTHLVTSPGIRFWWTKS